MTPQDLEDLLHRRSFLAPESKSADELVAKAIAEIQSEGRQFFVTRAFTNTPIFLGRSVRVPSDYFGSKEVILQYDDKMEGMKIDLVFYYPDEVEAL